MKADRTVISPLYADFAFPNTMKGQRGQFEAGGSVFAMRPQWVYATVHKMYFNWNELERTIEDGEDFIREVSDRRFGECRAYNARFIPRIALQWPNHGDHTKATEVVGRFPTDMVASTLDTPEFFFRVRNLIKKLGHVWNDDPRIAYIEAGVYGLWGEQHEDALSKAAQKNLADAFHEFFPDKKVMIRYPRDFMGEGFGMYCDSFAHIGEEHYARDGLRFLDWRTAVMGGEVAHNWGEHWIQPGDNMNDTLIDPHHRDFFLDHTYWQHNNHLGMWIINDETYDEAIRYLAEYQKIAGYRYVLEKVEYAAEDGQLALAFDVRNIGASPFYYRWPVSAALLDEEGNAVWEKDLEDVDIRTWMPGDQFNFETRTYDEPAKLYHHEVKLTLDGVRDGVYMLALAIKDPSCGKPNVRFATRQYLNGGWHPMGYVGVNCEVSNPIIPECKFDDMLKDQLTY